MKLKINKINRNLLVSIIISLLVLIVGTYAWLTWRSKETDLKLTVGNIDDTMVTISPYKINASILPALSYEEEEYANVEVVNNSNETKAVEVYYEISNIDTELVNENFKYTITRSIDNGTTYTEYKSGNFSNAVVNEEFMLLNEVIPKNTTYKYEIYTWLNSEDIDENDYVGSSFVGELNVRIAETSLTTVATLITNANPTTLMYEHATKEQKANMWTFNQAATAQTPATTDYRFIGDSPNNWIKFNGGEDWRIIGVFDGKIKIIKNTIIEGTNYYFDYKQSGVGSSTSNDGSSDWTDSQLMYMLNTPFYKNGNTYNTTLMTQELLTTTMGNNTVRTYSLDGNFIRDNKTTPNIIYELGKIPASIATSATSYSGSAMTWELNETAKSQIARTIFYLGGASSNENSATAWYNLERGIVTPNSNTSPRSWTGYIGLMYPSDYAYTYANGVDDTCFGNTYSCSEVLGEKSWLFNDILKNSSHPLTISPNQGYVSYVFGVYSLTATVYNSRAYYFNGVLPSIYLKSDIMLRGDGTKENPYRIVPYSQPEQPKITDGLIPVKIDNSGNVKTILSTDDNWYDYDSKEWANAILVTDGSRSKYLNTNNVPVTESDILAYYVWIPRYAYKIWDDDATDEPSDPQLINVMWEDGNKKFTNGLTVGEYRTHPAFWWDTDGDRQIDSGETISGIWVGKFETTGDAITPTIKPRSSPLVNQNVSTQFDTALKFTGSSLTNKATITYGTGTSQYGLTSTNYDSHMMKNSEWGAVAYLSHSTYGLGNAEIQINSTTTTGSGDGTTYGNGTSSHPQSTTGNITGIFDMSGGMEEFIMGNYGNDTGYDDTYNSGFNVDIETGFFTQLNNQKYYNLYSSDIFNGDNDTNVTKCTISTCGGHGIFETALWYDDYTVFTTSIYPWVVRGGYYNYGASAGIFGVGYFSGYGDGGTFRTVLN